jgi:alkanesulfonate monooxygenase SsuD/methylene tetrahydromethanopterin reductase-like flavin-dependent oxidoreductase (luciferase family)
MTTLGAVFLPQFAPERLRGIARAADDAGLEELWLWEDCFKESGVASAAAILAWTGRLRVGVGLLPVPLRNVALTAMEIATLERLFPGRLVVGVGHGAQDWMGQVGARVASPLTLLREYLVALRRLLDGEQVSTDGTYVRLDRVALDWPPSPAPALLAGAIGPRTLRLCGELADGTILPSETSPGHLREARRLVDEGRAAAGRDGEDRHHPVTVYLLAGTGPGAERRVLADLQTDPSDPAEVSVAGDARAVADAVIRCADAGADTVVLQPTADDPDPEGFMRFVAREVRPLVP